MSDQVFNRNILTEGAEIEGEELIIDVEENPSSSCYDTFNYLYRPIETPIQYNWEPEHERSNRTGSSKPWDMHNGQWVSMYGKLKFIKSIVRRQCCINPNVRKTVTFGDAVEFYFPREQGFCTVPTNGGCSLSMELSHIDKRQFNLDVHQYMRNSNPRSGNELYVRSRNRKAMMYAAGITIDYNEIQICNWLRRARLYSGGCSCAGFCLPKMCPCFIQGIGCLKNKYRNPCGCSARYCKNAYGREVFNNKKVQEHCQNKLAMHARKEETKKEKKD